MTNADIAHQRLHNQHIASPKLDKPAEVVAWLGAVQAQDYPAAKWGVGQRIVAAIDDNIEQAFARGDILRTHIMRPTWHFVTREDIRWMLMLTAPRVHAANAYYYRNSGLDDTTIARGEAIIAKALQGGNQLTRGELMLILERAGIAKHDVIRGSYIMMRAELDGVVCSGARRGKQFTYALLEERAPQARTLEHDEALATLTSRYFTSHGPATVQDYVWWSGLTVTSARAGIEMVKSQLASEVIEDRTYWRPATTSAASPTKDAPPTAYLLPNYDEYVVAYKDRSAIFDPAYNDRLDPRGNLVFGHTVIIDGQIVGTWKRTLTNEAVAVETNLFTPLSSAATRALDVATERYSKFVGLPAILHI